MHSRTAIVSTMAREIVLDANVIVAQFDRADALAARARELTERLRGTDATPVFLDFIVAEALSVISRRARERKSAAPDLVAVTGIARAWAERGVIRWAAAEAEHLWPDVLDVMDASNGRLNFNDAMLVVLQRQGLIGDVASFDQGFDTVDDFRRVR
jgi:predicted nucleic acid-binding protein